MEDDRLAPSIAAGGRGRWTATPRRVLLREQLAERTDPRLAAFYWEAIRSLREGEDAVRYGVAGHMLRELQAGLPEHLEVPEAHGSLGEFFNWLRDQWRKVLGGRTSKPAAEHWAATTIDRPLARFLATLHDKIEFYDTILPRRRDQHREVLARLDPGLGQSPKVVQDAAIDAWMRLNGVFNKAAHSVDPAEFEAAVEELEAFLVDRLIPRTFEKRDAIASAVREAEGRAHA